GCCGCRPRCSATGSTTGSRSAGTSSKGYMARRDRSSQRCGSVSPSSHWASSRRVSLTRSTTPPPLPPRPAPPPRPPAHYLRCLPRPASQGGSPPPRLPPNPPRARVGRTRGPPRGALSPCPQRGSPWGGVSPPGPALGGVPPPPPPPPRESTGPGAGGPP